MRLSHSLAQKLLLGSRASSLLEALASFTLAFCFSIAWGEESPSQGKQTASIACLAGLQRLETALSAPGGFVTNTL